LASESVYIIANPNSGGGKANRLLPRLEEGLREIGVPGSVRRTRGPGHAAELAREAMEDGVSRVLVVGGDGTIHEVANGILGDDGAERPALVILPVGTGNDFHRMVRGPGGLPGALRLIQEGVPRAFDVGEVRWAGQHRFFVNLLGVGVDTEVLRRRERFTRLSGVVQYLAALGTALVRFEHVPLAVDFPENPGSHGGVEHQPAILADVLLAAVMIGPSVGGGFFLAPSAEPDDGLLDIFVAERLKLIQIMRYLPRALRGRLGTEPEIHVAQVASLRFRSPDGRPFAFELDGELMDTEATSLEIGIRPQCLPVLELPGAES